MTTGKNEEGVPEYGQSKPLPDQKEEYYQQNSKPAVCLVASITGFLGLMFVIGILDRLPHIGIDDCSLILFAAVFLGFTVLFLRFSLRPSVMLSDREFLVRKFFGSLKWKYEDITELGDFDMKFHPKDARGRRMGNTITTEHVVIKSRDGKTKKFTLPTFGRNAQILASLSERTGLEIETLPMVDKTQSAR